MITEELFEKTEKEYRFRVYATREFLIKSLADLDISAKNVNVNKVTEDWNSFMDSVRYLEALQMLRDEDFINEL